METSFNYLNELRELLGRLPLDAIDRICEALYRAYAEGRTMYVFGNGGSAALASHIACDLGKGTHAPRPPWVDLTGVPRFKVCSVTDNVPMITAWGNDSAYEDIFAEQIDNFVQPGDVAFAISGSGNSPNVLRGLERARERGAINVGLTGFRGGKMLSLLDHALVVPSDSMQRIEDVHVVAAHLIFLNFRERIWQRGNVAPELALAGAAR